MYKKARLGEITDFTGVDGYYEIPSDADLVIDTEKHELDECVIKIIQYLKSRELVSSTN